MYEHEWRKGLVTTSNVRFDKQYSPEFFPFTYKGNSVTDVTAVDLTIRITSYNVCYTKLLRMVALMLVICIL